MQIRTLLMIKTQPNLRSQLSGLVSFLDSNAMAVLRGRTHSIFDRIWKEKHMTRTQAYAWLADQMKLSSAQTHIALFDRQQCLEAIYLCQEYLASVDTLFDWGFDET